MSDRIEGRVITPEGVRTMTNCRLKRTLAALQRLLTIVEEEIEGRLGQGGGGLK